MDKELLSILVCPKTKRPLRLATDKELAKINQKIFENKLKNIAGELVTEPIEEALVEPKGKILYIVEKGIPRLIYELGVKI